MIPLGAAREPVLSESGRMYLGARLGPPDTQVMQGSRHEPQGSGWHLVSADDVARTLRVHVSTIYRAAQDGTLPAVRVRGRVMFDPAAVAAAVTPEPCS
jgi:excisionase family DNA binding protein